MRLHFSEWKTNSATTSPPLIFLHGMGGTAQLWRPIAVALEDSFHIYAFDQRGHGKSITSVFGIPLSFGPLDYGADVIETMNAIGLQKSILVGHSMGVRTACAAAHLSPEKIAGMILIDLGLDGLAGGGLGKNLEKLLAQLPENFASRDLAREHLQRESPDPAIAQYLVAVAQQDKNGSVTFPFDRNALLQTLSAVKEFTIRPWIKEAASRGIPIWLLRGSTSHVWTTEQFKREKEELASFSNIQFIEFEGAGHGLPFEKRAQFVQCVRDFENWIASSPKEMG